MDGHDMHDTSIFFTLGLLIGSYVGFRVGYAAAVRHNGRAGIRSSWRRLRTGRW